MAMGVAVLRFNYDPDNDGHTIPPEAHATFKPVVPVTYGGDQTPETAVGHVRLKRQGNILLGDFTLFSTFGDSDRALKLMRKLFPAVGFSVHYAECAGDTILKLEVTHLILTPHSNADPKIERLGKQVFRRPTPAEVN